MVTSSLTVPFLNLGISFYGFLLPWIFSFAIVYGLLSKLDLFGGDKNRINVALAFVIAFFVTGVGGPQLATFFVNIFGGSAVFLAGILVVILFAALLGQEGWFSDSKVPLIIVVIIGVLLFVSSSGVIIAQAVVDANTAAFLFWIIVLIVAAYLITRQPEQQGAGGGAGGGTT